MHWASSVRTAALGGNGPRTRATGDLSPVAGASAAIVALGAIETALLFDQPGAPWQLALFTIAAWTWFAAGVVAARRRPGNRMGAIMVAGAFVWLGAGLANAPQAGLSAVGVVVQLLPLALVVHLLHAFPSGRLRGAASRAIVAAVYATALLLHAPAYLFAPGDAAATLQLADRPELVTLGATVQDAVGGALMVATGLLLALRMRAATHAQRQVLAPLAVYGIVAVVTTPLLSRLLDGDPLAFFTAQVLLLTGVPIAFAAAMAVGGFAPTAGVAQLSAWLGAADGAPATLRDAVAAALGDSSVALLLWASETGEAAGWVDADGRPAALPTAASARGVELVEADGRRVGAIVYDATLIADRAPVAEAARVIALALDRERLTAELLASRDRLRRSRARIAAAADAERRRIARDLHDGVQGRLVLLALRARELSLREDSGPQARAEAARLREELEGALATLRELVQGVLPAALVERGLGAAALDLADRMPLPTTVAAGDERFPPAVESAGWFVIAEALANAVRHARARALDVRVERAGGALRIEVRDDGVGGALVGTGSGLRGLADRLDVLGGRLLVDSPRGGGTRIVAEVPCAS